MLKISIYISLNCSGLHWSAQSPRISGPASRRSLAISKASSSFAWTCKSKGIETKGKKRMSKRSEDGHKKVGVILNTRHISKLSFPMLCSFNLIHIHFWGKEGKRTTEVASGASLRCSTNSSQCARKRPSAFTATRCLGNTVRYLQTQHNTRIHKV